MADSMADETRGRRRASCSQIPSGALSNAPRRRSRSLLRWSSERTGSFSSPTNWQRRCSSHGSISSESIWFRIGRRASDLSGSRVSSDGRTLISSYWSRIATRKDSAVPERERFDCREASKIYASIQWRSLKRTCNTAVAHPKILVATFVAFAVICAAGIAIVLIFAETYEESLRIDAVKTAKTMGQQIPTELNRALLPLFTLEEVVRQIDTFYDIPFKTAAAPMFTTGTGRVFRNVSGICDDPNYTLPYNEIAASIKQSANMPKILVNVQLAPFGVVCLLYPLINTEDFEEGTVMDNRGARGLELLNDPINGYYTREAIKHNRVTIQGPLKLVQGNVPIVKEALIARSPVYLDGHNLEIGGADYAFWGFSTVLLNWAQLKKQLGLYDFFESHGLEFLMTRTDTLLNFTTNEEYARVAVIAESKGSGVLNEGNSVSVPLKTTDNEWVLTVGCDCFDAPWKTGAAVSVVLGALFVSVAIMFVLVTKKEHELLLYRMMPRSVIHRLHRGETVIEKYDLATICFFDIVSFTAMSEQMEPIEVMAMLKELFAEFDKLATKYQVCNVETIGDAYIVIGGGPEGCNGREGAENVALFALNAIKAVRSLRFQNGSRISIRAGLASGLVIAGVVGVTQPKYTLFGDTVTLSSHMESTSESMRVQCSDMTCRLLRDSPNQVFSVKQRDGASYQSLPTWWINGATKRRSRMFGADPVSVSAAAIGAASCQDCDDGEINGVSKEPDQISGSDGNFLTENLEEHGCRRASFHSTDCKAARRISISSSESRSAFPPIGGPGTVAINTNSCMATRRGSLWSNSSVSVTVNAPDEELGKAPTEITDSRNDFSRFLTSLPSSERINHGIRRASVRSTSSRSLGRISVSSTKSRDADPPIENLDAVVSDANNGMATRRDSELSKGSVPVSESASEQELGNDPTEITDASKDSSQSLDAGTVEFESIYSKESAAFHNYWSRLIRENDAWQNDVGDEPPTVINCWTAVGTITLMKWRSFKRIWKIAATHRRILLITSVTCAILCAAGLTAVLVFAHKHEENRRVDAAKKAIEADSLISNELNKASLPLFAMAELLKQLDVFKDLPVKVANTSSFADGGRIFRNVSGICDDSRYTLPYDDIAASIKENSDLPKILVNVQLAPSGVLCLVYPLVNEEDFEDGNFLDNRAARGHDLLNDPNNGYYAREAVKGKRMTIQGPLQLIQRDTAVVEESLIVRYPVFIDGHNLTIDSEAYPFWGFANVVLNWAELKKRTEFFDFLNNNGLEFVLTKTDTSLNITTNEEYKQEVVIMRSEGSAMLNGRNSVSLPLQASDNDWVLIVGIRSDLSPAWKAWGSVCVVLGSFIVSLVLMVVLVVTKEHELLLYRMMPRDAIRLLQRGETVINTNAHATIFFSHIIGFTTLSGHMKPNEFMIMLNQIYGEFDKLVIKHQVNKVETIGDAYIVTGGENGGKGAENAALFALDAVAAVTRFRYKDMRLFVRAGLASGPTVSGVVGAALPKYTIFGDTVNFASRMESTSKSMKIQCSGATNQLLQESSVYDFQLEERREGAKEGILVKGKGLVRTWWVLGAHKRSSLKPAVEASSVQNSDPSDANAVEGVSGGEYEEAVSADTPQGTNEGADVRKRRVSFAP